MGELDGTAGCLEGLATVACDRGDFLRSACLLGAAASLRERTGGRGPPRRRRLDEQALSFLQEELGGEAFAAAWQEGRAMHSQPAVAYAVGDSSES